MLFLVINYERKSLTDHWTANKKGTKIFKLEYFESLPKTVFTKLITFKNLHFSLFYIRIKDFCGLFLVIKYERKSFTDHWTANKKGTKIFKLE